jgi:hypothetical protein
MKHTTRPGKKEGSIAGRLAVDFENGILQPQLPPSDHAETYRLLHRSNRNL